MTAARPKPIPTLTLEKTLAKAVGGLICGVDEAGREIGRAHV